MSGDIVLNWQLAVTQACTCVMKQSALTNFRNEWETTDRVTIKSAACSKDTSKRYYLTNVQEPTNTRFAGRLKNEGAECGSGPVCARPPLL